MATNPNAAPPAPGTQERSQPRGFNPDVDRHNFVGVRNNIHIAANAVNKMPDFATGSNITTIDDVETFMPGAKFLEQYAHEAGKAGRGPTDEEKPFLEAMKWKAAFWHEKAKRERIDVSDYDNDRDPLAYSKAMDAAIRTLANEALARKAEAESHGHAALAEEHQVTADGLERYRQLFNPQPNEEQFTPNQDLAKEYIKAAKQSTGATSKHLDLMMDQAEYDHVYAIHNTAIKNKMREQLDAKDEEEVRKDKIYLKNNLRYGVARRYAKKQKGFGFRKVSIDQEKHDNYNNGVVRLVDREARIAARAERDKGKKFEEDDFLVKRTNEIYSELGELTAEKHKGKWNFKRKKEEREGLSRAILNAVTGRDLEGKKVKKGWEKHLKRAVRLGSIATVLALGSATGGTLLFAGAAAGGHYYLNKRAKAGAERVANKKAGVPSKEALGLAVKSVSGDRLAKIVAANKLNKESNERITKKLRLEHAKHVAGASAFVLVGGVAQFGGADFAFDRLHDVTRAIGNEWNSWADAWSIDERPQVPPPPDMPDWYWQSPEDLGMPHN